MNMIRSPGDYRLWYIALMSAHIGLVWLFPYFPTQDGPSHLYNLVILHDLLNGGKDWGQYFTYQLQAIPNLGFEAISFPLLNLFPLLAVEKIFVSLYIILLGISVPVFLSTFGRHPFPLTFLILPVVFNFTLMMGFYSYAIAIPLFLICASLAWRNRNGNILRKVIIFNISGTIIFYFHLIPFIYYIVFLLIMTLAGIAEFNDFKKYFVNVVKFFIIISPSLVNLYLYLGAARAQTPTSKVLRVSFDYLLKDLCFFSTVTFSRFQLVPAYLLLAFVIVGVYMSFKDFISSGWRFAEKADEKRTLFVFVAVLVLIYFLMPFRFGGGSYFNERLPWIIFLCGLPLLFLPETSARKNWITFAGITISIIFLICNMVIFSQQCAIVSEYLRGLRLGLPRNALGMGYKTKDNEWSRIDVLTHAASYYGIYKGIVDIGNYEARLPYFPVQFRKTLPPLPPKNQIYFFPAKINWPLYPSVRYLFAWEPDAKERSVLGKDFHTILEDGRLIIWERNFPAQGHPGQN